jgi:protein-tyrosine kinase
MGRVYKALVRAERFQDTDRPIGRPERNGAGTSGKEGAAQGFSRKPSSASAVPLVFEDNFDLTEDPSSSRYNESSAAMASTEVPAAVTVPAPLQRSRVPLACRPVSKAPVPSAPVIAFEEPNEVSSIRDLTIDPHVAALTGGDSLATERYRALAVKLLNLTDRRTMKTLLITSAQAGDGKTTIATGAAWSLAKGAERRVLLIDASPTSSSVGRMLGIDPKRGWLNLLDGSSDLKQALIRLEPKGLYLLTAGAMSSRHAGDPWSARLEDLIADLAPRFDLVIVDSGSLLESSEAQRLASVLDGTVIVARANHTHHSKVAAARKLVPKLRRLGVVLNDSGVNAGTGHQASRGSGLVGRLFGRRR